MMTKSVKKIVLMSTITVERCMVEDGHHFEQL